MNSSLIPFFCCCFPVMHRVLSSHAPAQQLQCSSSSTHPPRLPTTRLPRVRGHGRAAAISNTPGRDLFAFCTPHWIQVWYLPMWLFSVLSSCYIYSYAHVSRSFSLCRCSSCLVVFGGLNSVKFHIQQAHCDMFHKCPSCPMAFKSAPSIQNHISTQHPTLTEGQTMYMSTHTLTFFSS